MSRFLRLSYKFGSWSESSGVAFYSSLSCCKEEIGVLWHLANFALCLCASLKPQASVLSHTENHPMVAMASITKDLSIGNSSFLLEGKNLSFKLPHSFRDFVNKIWHFGVLCYFSWTIHVPYEKAIHFSILFRFGLFEIGSHHVTKASLQCSWNKVWAYDSPALPSSVIKLQI